MKRVSKAFRLELEAIFYTRLKLMILILASCLAGLGLAYTIIKNQQDDEAGLKYAISIDEGRDGDSYTFSATNNEVEQLYDDVITSSNPTSIGQSVAIANDNLMAVGAEDDDGLLTVHILRKVNGNWQEDYSFSYEAASASNYNIPNTQKPTATDTDLEFGASIAFHGNNLLAIGAPGWQGAAIADDWNTTEVYEGDDGTNRGTVYIFELNSGAWQLVSTIRGTEPSGRFGSSVSFSPLGVLAIGAESTVKRNYNTETAVCPLFQLDDFISVPEGDTNGDGVINRDDDLTEIYIRHVACPAVYLYERDSGQGVAQWNKADTITANEYKGLFGSSVSFAGEDLLAIGMPRYQANPIIRNSTINRADTIQTVGKKGGVILYAQASNGDWSQELVISDFRLVTASTENRLDIELENTVLDEFSDGFGYSVNLINSTTLLVSSNKKGVLLVFEKSGETWSKTGEINGTKLLTGDPLPQNSDNLSYNFGYAMASYNNTLAVTQKTATGTPDSINLLDWNTFKPGTTWRYLYIDDDRCNANDFVKLPSFYTSYTEGTTITELPTGKEGQRLCFEADSGADGKEFLASGVIDDPAQVGFENPSLSVSEAGILSIYFDERVRQPDDSELDEQWVRAKLEELKITAHGISHVETAYCNDSNSTVNNGNCFVSVEHINNKTILKIQLHSTWFKLSYSDPTVDEPHRYRIVMYDLEDTEDNPQNQLVAEQYITGYTSNIPTISIEEGSDQTIIATDVVDGERSTLVYVWQSQSDACDETTDFSSANSYTEGDPIRLEETHNDRQICFRSTNDTDSTLKSTKSYDVNGVDRTAPQVSITMTADTLTATDNSDEETAWLYVLIDDNVCDSTVDFMSGNVHIESEQIIIDNSVNSPQANKYFCFRALDNAENIGYGVSDLVDSTPPVITTRISGNAVTVTVTDDSDIDTGSLVYKLVSQDTCDEVTLDLDGDPTPYTNGETIRIIESYQDSFFCFTATDAVGNSSWKLTDALTWQNNPSSTTTTTRSTNRASLSIIVTNPNNANLETTKTVSATSNSKNTAPDSWRWKAFDPTNDNCSNELMTAGLNIYNDGQALILNSETFNGLQICFTASDTNGNTAYAPTTTITGISESATTTETNSADNQILSGSGGDNNSGTNNPAPITTQSTNTPPATNNSRVANKQTKTTPPPLTKSTRTETKLTELGSSNKVSGFNVWSLPLILGLAVPFFFIIFYFISRRRPLENDNALDDSFENTVELMQSRF